MYFPKFNRCRAVRSTPSQLPRLLELGVYLGFTAAIDLHTLWQPFRSILPSYCGSDPSAFIQGAAKHNVNVIMVTHLQSCLSPKAHVNSLLFRHLNDFDTYIPLARILLVRIRHVFRLRTPYVDGLAFSISCGDNQMKKPGVVLTSFAKRLGRVVGARYVNGWEASK